jgi:GDP-mannose 6-dehydrogenase
MIISVLGLGYVGTTIGLCLSRDGYEVHGYDISTEKVKLLNTSKLHIYEPNLNSILTDVIHTKFFAYESLSDKIIDSDIIIICVGTPTSENGAVDLTQLKSALADLDMYSSSLSDKTIILRSTVPPGTTESLLHKYFSKEQVFYMPEFLREGSAISDFSNSNCIIGSECEDSPHISNLSIFPNFDTKQVVSIKAAEFIKYVNNSFHALKVCFANEVGSISKELGIANGELFDIFLSDSHLNISEAYLKPGFSFGGSCLTKDLKALNHISDQKQIQSRALSSLIDSNNDHTMRYVDLILTRKRNNICFAGVSFKPNTDDQRFSPVLTIIDKLLQLPSYNSFKQLTILDSENVKTKIEKRYFNSLVFDSNYKTAFSNTDLIVWGSLYPSDEVLDELSKNNTQLINLGFFPSHIFEKAGIDTLSVI